MWSNSYCRNSARSGAAGAFRLEGSNSQNYGAFLLPAGGNSQFSNLQLETANWWFPFFVVYLMVSFFCGIFDGFLFLSYIWWFLLLCSRAVPCDFGHPLVAPDNRKHVSWAIFSRSFHICDYFSHILLLFLHLMRSLRVFAMHRWLFIQNLVSKAGAGGHHPAKTTTYVASNLRCAAAFARNARLKVEKTKFLLAFKWKVGKNKPRNEAFKMTREPK